VIAAIPKVEAGISCHGNRVESVLTNACLKASQLGEEMKAIIKATNEADSLQVVDMPTPRPGPGEVLVQIKATGICYSDVSVLNNTYKGRRPVPIPLIMGHEGAGVITELGIDVSGHKVGDRVALDPLSGCGKCLQCKNGFKNMCTGWEHIGLTCHGTFAEYIALPADLAHKMPDNMDFADAAFLEPLSLVVRSLEKAKLMVGETVAILGPGSLGMFHLQAFKAAGASKVIMIGLEQDRKRFDIARDLGADHIVNISREDPLEMVQAYTGGLGADIVIETANSPKATQLSFDLAAPRGRVILFGLYPEAFFSPVQMLRKGLTVFGDVAVLPQFFLTAMNWVVTGKVSVQKMITKRFSLDQAKEAFEAGSQGDTVKVLFEL
jgi:threonine dehydrogenase-like Zn-dependent dehydrogenase